MMECGAGREISGNLEASARLQKGWQMDFFTCQLRKTVDGLCEMEPQAPPRLSQQCSDRLAMPAFHWVWGVVTRMLFLCPPKGGFQCSLEK